MDYSESNKILWDIETDELNILSYKLYIKETNERNNKLHESNDNKRIAYCVLSYFVNNYVSDKYKKKSIIILRKNKINKLKNKTTCI